MIYLFYYPGRMMYFVIISHYSWPEKLPWYQSQNFIDIPTETNSSGHIRSVQIRLPLLIPTAINKDLQAACLEQWQQFDFYYVYTSASIGIDYRSNMSWFVHISCWSQSRKSSLCPCLMLWPRMTVGNQFTISCLFLQLVNIIHLLSPSIYACNMFRGRGEVVT